MNPDGKICHVSSNALAKRRIRLILSHIYYVKNPEHESYPFVFFSKRKVSRSVKESPFCDACNDNLLINAQLIQA